MIRLHQSLHDLILIGATLEQRVLGGVGHEAHLHQQPPVRPTS